MSSLKVARLVWGDGNWRSDHVTLDRAEAYVGAKIANGTLRSWYWARGKSRGLFI
jgi:hypothetical protein